MMQAVLEGVALRAAEVMQAMAAMLPLGHTISVDGGLANNDYFMGFLSNALNRTLTVASSTELTALGTARMAMLGLTQTRTGAMDLPPLPPPSRVFRPDHPLTDDLHGRFGDAVSRAKGWR